MQREIAEKFLVNILWGIKTFLCRLLNYNYWDINFTKM